VNELLEQYNPKLGEADLRGFEWHYLHKLCHPELVMFRGEAVAFSPDGKRLAVGTRDSVKILDVQTNRELRLLKGRVRSIVFSPDSKRLVGATRDEANQGTGTVAVWDSETGQEFPALKGLSAVFSHDGKRIVTTVRDGANEAKEPVKVWDVQSGKQLLSLTGWVVAFSPDDKRLATAGGGPVKVWDVQTGDELLSLGDQAYSHVAYSPDGKRLASSSESEVKVWDAQSGEETFSLKGHNQQIEDVAFSPDGRRLATGSYDKTVKVWDTLTGNELFSLKGHTSTVWNVVFNHDGTRLASVGGDGTVKIWDTSNNREVPAFRGATDAATGVSFSADGQRMCSAMKADPKTGENVIKIWDANSGQEILAIRQPPGNRLLRVVTISPDGRRVAAGYGSFDEAKNRYVSGDVWVWDAQTGVELATLNGHSWAVVGLAFSPDSSRLVSCASNPSGWGRYDQGKPCEVKVWDAGNGEELFALVGHNSFVDSVAYSPDGKRLATLSRDNTLKLWDAQTGRELVSLPVQVTGVTSIVAFSPDGKRLASSNNPHPYYSAPELGSQLGQIKVWDAETGQELLTMKGHTIRVKMLAFSPDGKRLASNSGPGAWHTLELKLWDAETGAELLTFEKQNLSEKQNLGGRGFAFSPDGQRLVTAGPDGLKIVDATPFPQPMETKPER
jgi:WD40 repeat protein